MAGNYNETAESIVTDTLPVVPASDSANALLREWLLLSQQSDADPSRYDNFLKQWPQAPESARIAKNREDAAVRRYAGAALLQEFAARPPKSSPDAQIAYAETLLQQGQTAQATKIAQQVYFTPKALGSVQEKRLYALNVLRLADATKRLGLLLDADQKIAANTLINQSSIPLPAATKHLATLFLQARDKTGATAQALAALSPAQQQTPLAFLTRVRNMRHGNSDVAAAQLIASMPTVVRQSMPKTAAREAMAATRNLWGANQMTQALRAAQQCVAPADDMVLQGECAIITARAALLAKQGALAEQHAQKALQVSKNPINRARAAFDAGRAATLQNKPAQAQNYYLQAAQQYPYTFYGQLAIKAAGLNGVPIATPTPTAPDRQRFDTQPFVRAAARALTDNDKETAIKFLTAAARSTKEPAQLQLLTNAAQAVGGAAGALKFGKATMLQGNAFMPALFPQAVWLRDNTLLPQGLDLALVQGITRHESSFAPNAEGADGDTGLMQLMPPTAAPVAAQLGIDLSPPRALFRPDYNIRIGSTYIGQMLRQYNNSPVLATAAYNAGPGRANQWLNTFGDPRSTVSVIDWLDRISFDRTRDYVQRVLEAQVVYKALAGDQVIRGIDNATLQRVP